ncbi:MAG: DnaD domain protein [Lachnospiraceae bacterium]|nr:DnaD domain protein [Lachnospiraceae bacterium]
MGNISLTNNNTSGTTSVSNIFIDKYMPNANGEFVKIFLYLLRCSSANNCSLSICKIADTFKYTENDVVRALMYWEQFGLISLTYSSEKNISGICINEYKAQPAKKAAPSNPFTQNTILSDFELEKTANINSDETTKSSSESELPKKHTYTANELAAFDKNEEIQMLMKIAETFLGRTLTRNDINTLLYIYDGLNFPFELIDYLIEYCVSNNHTSIRYIEKVALEWANNDITTVELAKSSSEMYSKKYTSIIKAFGIKGRSLGKVEKDYIAKWTDEYEFDIDIILDACNRTINATHQPSFKYADSILTKWNNLGIKALSDIKMLDTEHIQTKNFIPTEQVAKAPAKKNVANFTQRTYDFDKLEKELLANTGGGY